ncbi:MAG TPA: UDP-glucose/GDP-mannose dehydrogenase family protein [Roseiflexaceae bacterium]|nr:UDP-glucose/GDP-mannose dehydrogenase family protein [Roseiflexaceae bacterium]
MTTISVFGLGYVGSVLVACLADNGHNLIGVDVNPTKVEMIQEGRSPVIEHGLDELLHKGVAAGRVRATTDATRAIRESDLSFICVGTPSNPNDSLNLTYVERVAQQIGEALATKDGYHIVVTRSTMLPGSTEEIVIPILERASGRRAGHGFGVCFNPEFLREGSSIADFYDPPFTIIGADDAQVADSVAQIYAMLSAPLMVVPFKVAEMVKYANNAFHALKVAFANEIGNLCKLQGIDSHRVMEIFCQDRKLNLSPYYLKPGFAFGGSCLPKDLRAILYQCHHYDLYPPVLQAILPSNQRQIELAYQMVKRTGRKHVGVLGFSFKAGTDDLRESPVVELIEHLIGKGYHVRVYDRNVSLANLHGANRAYIEQEIPHIASLMVDSLEDILAESEVIVIGNRAPEFQRILPELRAGQTVIDLVRIADDGRVSGGPYQGICW